jgi:uncharacterized integral membrane protein
MQKSYIRWTVIIIITIIIIIIIIHSTRKTET